MSFDTGLLEQLIEINKRRAPKYLLRLGGLNYAVTGVLIMNSRIPVNKPTTRGGAYFSEKFAYKIKRYNQGPCSGAIINKADARPKYRVWESEYHSTGKDRAGDT